MSDLAARTRLFAALSGRVTQPIEEVTDYPAQRQARSELVSSLLGRRVFGTVDRRVGVETVDIPLKGRTLRALLYRPTAVGVGPRPVIVNYHGGGWVQGDAEQSGWLSSRVAARTGCVVVAPDYRLAPEHPFPAAVDDANGVLSWVVRNADRLHLDPGRVAVMGDSAGGNLAAVAALYARDVGTPALAAQILIYPSVDMYEMFPSELRLADAPVLTSANMRAFVHLYLADAYGTDDWRASPLKALTHKNLPPTFILTASNDPLLDNGARYRDVLRAAGVAVRYREYPGAIHGFMSLPGVVPVAKKALDDIVEFVAHTVVAGV